MAKRLTGKLCLEGVASVMARVNQIKPSIETLRLEVEAAYKSNDSPALDRGLRELVAVESECDLLELVAYSLKKASKAAGGFGPPCNIVPKEFAQLFGVIVFAADICKVVPELVVIRRSIFCHYGVNEACIPSLLPGGGAGPGEVAKLHNIVVPETLVQLYDPRFKEPLSNTMQKRLKKLIAESSGGGGKAEAPPKPRKPSSSAAHSQRPGPSPFPQIPSQQQGGGGAPSPFPQIPAQQGGAPSPFPDIPLSQSGSMRNVNGPSPFPEVPAGNMNRTATTRVGPSPYPDVPVSSISQTGSMRTQRPYSTSGLAQTTDVRSSQNRMRPPSGNASIYRTHEQAPGPISPASAAAARPEMFPSAPQASDQFPSVPKNPAPRPASQVMEEPTDITATAPSATFRGAKEDVTEPVRSSAKWDGANSEPQSEPTHEHSSGKNSGLFGKLKKAFSHRKEESEQKASAPSPSPSAPAPAPQPVAEVKIEPVSTEPAAPTPENGEVVQVANSDVEISPQNLTFGLSSRQAPVDSDLKDEITVKNKHKQTIIVLLEHVKDEKTDFKYDLTFSHPVSFALKGLAEEKLTATLKIHCTTKLEIHISVKTWKEGAKKYKDARLSFATESQLTTKLDPDELKRDETIGEGAFGSVYSGRYRGMDVAIKVLKHQEYLTPEMKEDFTREVDMMEKLRHNAILNFVGAVHIPGQLSIVTELCQYGSFLSSMKKYPKDFTEALRVKTLLDASNGMDFLHQSGIIHRDLKPDNLLMVSLEPRSSVVAKLSDFGTTRDVNSYAAQMQSTKGVGTPLFMAPEIFMGKSYDKSVDLYSFSLIIYVAFATELPFEGDPCAATPWAFADAIKSGKRPGVPPSCPPEIAQIMEKCWDNEPSKRPSFEDVHMFFRKFYKEHYPQ